MQANPVPELQPDTSDLRKRKLQAESPAECKGKERSAKPGRNESSPAKKHAKTSKGVENSGEVLFSSCVLKSWHETWNAFEPSLTIPQASRARMLPE